jgi:hypothetical protein
VRHVTAGAPAEGFLAVADAVDEDEEPRGEDAADADAQEGEAGLAGVEVISVLADVAPMKAIMEMREREAAIPVVGTLGPAF